MKKKIGITDSGGASFPNYVNWFTSEDTKDDIEVVKLDINSHDYKSCTGFVISGGIDVHPDSYDGDHDYPNRPDEWNEARDQYEETVYKYAKMNKMPVLAICRGLQLVNTIEGGTLIQDLGDGNNVHKKGEADKEHVVVIDSRTFLGEITGAMSGKVNSAHHQAADLIGNSLMVSARSKDDDIVEALEFKDKINKGFLICVQWHPERMADKETSALSKSIKKAFVTAVRSQKV